MRFVTLLLVLLSILACGAYSAAPPEAGGLWQDDRIFVAVGETISTSRSRILVEMLSLIHI